MAAELPRAEKSTFSIEEKWNETKIRSEPTSLNGGSSIHQTRSSRQCCSLTICTTLGIVIAVVVLGIVSNVFLWLQVCDLRVKLDSLNVPSSSNVKSDPVLLNNLQMLQENVSMLHGHIYDELQGIRDEFSTKITATESQLDSFANDTNAQIANLISDLNDVNRNLVSTRETFFASNTALEVDISQLNTHANNTNMYLENLTSTLIEVHDALQQNLSHVSDQFSLQILTIVSQLDTYTEKTNEQLRNLTFAQNVLQRSLVSTGEDFLASKSALEGDILRLNAHANNTDVHLQNLTSTLGEVHDLLHQNVSVVRAELTTKLSEVESQLNMYANRTDAQLKNLTSIQGEVQQNLMSTRESFLASTSAIEIDISGLNAHANSTDVRLQNLTATLGEVRDVLHQNISLVRRDFSTNLSAIESQLDTHVNTTNAHLQNLTLDQNELQLDLASTREQFLASTLALEEDVSQLSTHANSTDINLGKLAASLGEVRDALEQNISLVSDEFTTKISVIGSELDTHAKRTDVQLRNLTSTQNEIQDNLASTREYFLASKSATEEDILRLDARANNSDTLLEKLASTLGEVHDLLHQNVSVVRAELTTKLSEVESKLNTHANKTDAQLRNLTSTQSEVQHTLASTREDLFSSKTAFAVDISLLTTHANRTDMRVKDLTSTLGNVRDALHQNLSHVRNELFVEISSIESNISQLNIHADTTDTQLRNFTSAQNEMRHNLASTRENSLASNFALEEEISQLNAWANDTKVHLRNNTYTLGELQNIVGQIQKLSSRQSRRLDDSNMRITELEIEINGASTASSLYLIILFSISFFVSTVIVA